MQSTHVAITIPNGQAVAPAIDVRGLYVVRIGVPVAGWTAAPLTFSTSLDGVTFVDLYDDQGNELTVQAAAGRSIIIDPGRLLGDTYLRVRSGTAAAPVNQGADRVLGLRVRDL